MVCNKLAESILLPKPNRYLKETLEKMREEKTERIRVANEKRREELKVNEEKKEESKDSDEKEDVVPH